VAAGSNNPLGDYAIRLGIPGYLIHGTNKPYGVGMAISHGCVRLYPEDIELLFKHVKTATPVRLLHQPFLIGWDKEELFIQVYPRTHINKKRNRKRLATFKRKLKRIERGSKRQIAWHKVETAISRSNGIPIAVFTDSINNESVAEYSHPLDLDDRVKPASLISESWRVKVTEFPDEHSAKRFAVMLNHQGPPIPAHAISGDADYIVVAGPFDSAKKAKKSIARLRIDFGLDAGLIEPGKDIPGIQDKFSFFTNMLSVLD
jgi:L,D-transpeptidase ErfK/SrfK